MSEHQHVGHDYVSANEAHFDAEAQSFDARPETRELAKRVCKAIRTTYPELFDENKTEIMDFACGSGECGFCVYTNLTTLLIPTGRARL